MKIDHKAFQQFAADNKLTMSLDFNAMNLCQVTVHGVDGGKIEGQGNCIQAAIVSAAVTAGSVSSWLKALASDKTKTTTNETIPRKIRTDKPLRPKKSAQH